jgi:putative aminopeptidase FrvX
MTARVDLYYVLADDHEHRCVWLAATIIYRHPYASGGMSGMADGKAMMFLEELINSFGPSGFEKEPARIVKDYVSKFSDHIYSDKLGSLMFEKRGTRDEPVVLVPGHIDEVGFIVSSITKQGFLTFNPLGGWSDQVLLAQRVLVRTEKGLIPGVIAAKPPHLLPPRERDKLVVKEKMFIDIGASNAEEAEAMGARIGNPVIPASRFSTIRKRVFRNGKSNGEDTIVVGKALDNRVGAWTVAEVIRTLAEKRIRHPNKVIGAATTLEEEGLRGAHTAAYITRPDVCIVLDTDIAGDVPGIEVHEAAAKMGYGPALTTCDESMVPNQGLLEFVIKTAEKNKIPLQLSQVMSETDAGPIHVANAGCPTVALGVPARHVHSNVGMLSMTDADDCVRLVIELIKHLDRKTVDSFVEQ